MKKFFLFCCVLLTAACSNDLEDVVSHDSQAEVRAYLEGSNGINTLTRTSINGDNDVVWMSDDRISVFFATNENQEYVIKEGQGTSSAVFSYKSRITPENIVSIERNYAVYPFNEANAINDGVITTSLAQQQQYETNSFANGTSIAVAASTNSVFSFRNTVGLLRLKIRKTGSAVNHLNIVKITSSEKSLSGPVAIDVNNSEPIAVPSGGGNSSVELICNTPVTITDNYTSFNVVLPVSDYAKGTIDISFLFDESSEMSSTTAVSERTISIRRSAITTLYVDIDDKEAKIDYSSYNEPYVDLENVGDYNSEALWENGSINYSTGYEFTSTKRLKMKTYIPQDVDVIVIDDAYRAYLFAYENDNMVGAWNNLEFSTSSITGMRSLINLYDYKDLYPTYRFKLVLYKKEEGTISTSECSAVNMFNSCYFYNTYIPSVNTGKTIMTFIDDDGASESVSSWEDLYDACGVVPTFALITSKVGEPNRITWDDVERLKLKGFEFISHTHNHKNLKELTEEQVRTEFSESKTCLEQHGCNSNFVVYPFNQHSEISDALLPQYFLAGFSENNDMNTTPLNVTALGRYSFLGNTTINVTDSKGGNHTVLSPKTEIQYNKILDEALVKNGWVVFMCHFRNTYGDNYHYGDDIRNSMVQLVKSTKSRGIKILTVGEAYAYLTAN